MVDDKALKGNSCGVCRAMGKPSCSCPKGGGAGGDEESKEIKGPELQDKPSAVQITALSSLLENSDLFEKKQEGQFTCIKLNESAAVAEIELVMDEDTDVYSLTIVAKEPLSEEQQKSFDELCEHIKSEVASMEGVSVTSDAGKLSVNFSNMKQMYTAMTKLVNNNVIPLEKSQLESSLANSGPEQQESQGHKFKTPFDGMYDGPKPSGADVTE